MRTKEERYNLKKKLMTRHGNCCYKCGLDLSTAPQGMAHFHHVDSNNKVANIADMIIRDTVYSEDDVKAENEKTILLCASCHMALHREYGKKVTEDNTVSFLFDFL